MSVREGAEQTWAVRILFPLAIAFAVFEVVTIHSVLSGTPAMGALQGCALAALGIAVTLGLTPEAKRPETFARAALQVSLLGLGVVSLLAMRFAGVRGGWLLSAPMLRTALLIVFQAGWAVSNWLRVVREHEGQSRYLPAALGTVVLLAGGLLSEGLPARAEAPKAATANDVAGPVYDQFVDPEDLSFALETAVVGQPSGSAFAHYHPGKGPLLGLRVSTLEWFGKERIGGDLRGIFEAVDDGAGDVEIRAPDGFVVVAVDVQGDEYIDAIRVQFAPFDGGIVSPFDRVWSDWVGGHVRNGRSVRLEGDSRPVVGIRGTGGLPLNSLSLLVG